MENLERILSEHRFFKGLEPEFIATLVGCASNVRFAPSDFLFREGQEANAFFLLRHGEVDVEIAGPSHGVLRIQTMVPGDVLGWSWLIPPYRWRFDARAVGIVRAVALDGSCLREKCESNHDLGYELLKRFSSTIEDRLQSTRLQLLDVYSNHN